MGKFDGVLIASDFDNTVVHTAGALRSGQAQPPLSQANREALLYFMEQGGVFSIATGRAMPAFAPMVDSIPMNGPTILGNGAAIYDFSTGKFVHTAFLPETVRKHARQIQQAFPKVAFEIYHDDKRVETICPNWITREHQRLTQSPAKAVESIDCVPSPVSKILLEEEKDYLLRIADYIRSQPWSEDYEVVLSADCLMELTAKGATKGGMVRYLAEHLGIAQEHIYCVGDHNNDISMLEAAQIPFAPQNAVDAVRELSGVHILPNCWENAIAAMIAELDTMY